MRRLFFLTAAATALCASAQAGTLDLAPTGLGQPFSTQQPFTTLTPLVQTTGVFQDIGSVRFFAGNFTPGGFARADGSILPISGNDALFAQLGTTYGGDGRSSVALPDLRGRTVVGAGGDFALGAQVGSETVTLSGTNLPPHVHASPTGLSSSTGDGTAYNNMMPGLALDFAITTQGFFPSRDAFDGPAPQRTIGFVHIDAARDGDGSAGDLGNYVSADGRINAIGSNTALFSILGSQYGGDGRTTFALPDTGDRVVTGAGTGPGLSPRNRGQATGSNEETLTRLEMPRHTHAIPGGGETSADGFDDPENNLQEEIALRWLIATGGIFPSRDGGGYNDSATFIGEMGLFAGDFAPSGWVEASGQLLSIPGNEALFSILGAQYGGDGRTTFGLPDMRGRVAVGTRFGVLSPGQQGGTEGIMLGVNNLPGHTHTVPAPVIPLPAAGWLLLAALGGMAALRRRAGG